MEKRRMEILAPAGDGDMLRAAVYSGADCVYLGVEGFNARRGAQNFDAAALAEATAFCHARGCGVYAALNTLVQPGEHARLAEAVRGVAEAGCDAIIVQDLATALEVQRAAPGVALHASTQMSVHSLAGVQRLAALGFTRAILARELTGEEIAAIAAESPIELEVFVHGALCVCVSGQCGMSAFLGGRSANRGACAGPCRLPFRAESAAATGAAPATAQHHLSLKDLSILDALPELAAMGIASAKIEGRLRGPEYVAVVVDAARKARDGQPYDKRLLADVFSRSGFTDGWFTGHGSADMFGTRTEADTGALKAALPAARQLYRREMPRVPVTMRLSLAKEGAKLCVQDGNEYLVEVRSTQPLSEAQRDATGALEMALAKTGGTPFFVPEGGATVEANGLFLPGSVAGALRREALEKLLAIREAARPQTARETTPLVDLLQVDRPQKSTRQNNQSAQEAPALRARFESVQALPHMTDLQACEAILLPLAEWQQVPAALRPKTWLWLPRILFPFEEQRAAALVDEAATAGFAGFEVHSLAHIQLCKGHAMAGGFGLNITNAAALGLYLGMGCQSATLSPELTLRAMRDVLQSAPGAQTDMLAYGHLPLMVTRADPLANGPGGAQGTLVDRKGKRFAVESRGAVREIHNPVPLWLADRLNELPTQTATLYFTLESPAEAARVLQAYQNQAPATGEFTRGLYDKGTV